MNPAALYILPPHLVPPVSKQSTVTVGAMTLEVGIEADDDTPGLFDVDSVKLGGVWLPADVLRPDFVSGLRDQLIAEFAHEADAQQADKVQYGRL